MEHIFKGINNLILIFLLAAECVIAQSAQGKLSGTISDFETGEPLIGANIIFVGTHLGAATDVDGKYNVLNITPGTYDVKISYIGYSSKVVKNIRIVSGITFELNEKLQSGMELDEIVVTQKKFFEEKATNTVKVLDSDQISKLPVQGIASIVSMQAGVVSEGGSGGEDGNAVIHVRGGRGGEVMYIVDGVAQNNLLTASSKAQVSNNAIEQISFEVGGYEAKYGQALSGIVNVTTKSGSPVYQAQADFLTSSFTDNYGFNQYSLSVGGPIIPGNTEHSFFISGERGWFKDANPSAIKLEYPSINKSYDYKPNNSSGVWRLTGKTKHILGDFSVNLSANINTTNGRSYIHDFSKNNSEFFPEFDRNNTSISARISQTLSNNTFWSLTAGYRNYNYEKYDPHFKDNISLYGDSTAIAALGGYIPASGYRVGFDSLNIFYDYGRVTLTYEKNANTTFNLDFDLTSQVSNHLFQFGGGINYSFIRSYSINAYRFAGLNDTLSTIEKYEALNPSVYGYDVTGKDKTGLDNTDKFLRPRNPLIGYTYIQDRFELKDLVLNLGVRMDYFDVRANVLKNPELPFAGGTDPIAIDDEDFKVKDIELEFSPRIGLGFPVTQSTVFHAQFGRFIQLSALNDLYTSRYDWARFTGSAPPTTENGYIVSEKTNQYEVGFRQVLGETAALNFTAFYKNIKGLVNIVNQYFKRTEEGEWLRYNTPNNSDFGTIKGLALSFDVRGNNYFNLSTQYTYSIAEGTGSSTSSSSVVITKSDDHEPPKIIAPLSFDQRHTAVINLDLSIPEGKFGFLEMIYANFLFSFGSGRPYTPLEFYNPNGGSTGNVLTSGYINSRYGPSTFRVDLRIEKVFLIGKFQISPYLWIENLFDADNAYDVWPSTGDPYSSAYLNTEDGKALVENNGEAYRQDFVSLEKYPSHFGIPRLIRLGLKIKLQ